MSPMAPSASKCVCWKSLWGVPVSAPRQAAGSVTEDGRIYALRLRMALADIVDATDDVLALPREDELAVAAVRHLPRTGWCAACPALCRRTRAETDAARQPGDGGFLNWSGDAAIRMGAGGWEGCRKPNCSPMNCWRWPRPVLMAACCHTPRKKLWPVH